MMPFYMLPITNTIIIATLDRVIGYEKLCNYFFGKALESVNVKQCFYYD